MSEEHEGYIVYELDRDGNAYRELLRSPFSDIAETCALALAKHHWTEETIRMLDFESPGAPYAVYENGAPWRVIQLEEHTIRRWQLEPYKGRR